MFYGETIEEVRKLYFDSWYKFQHNQLLTSLEQQLVDVIVLHPEYHSLLNNPETFQSQAYYPELGDTNPFLHMGLHLAIREQIATDRPPGIRLCYTKLMRKHGDVLSVEHIMIEHLAEALWLSQKNNTPPDEGLYLRNLTNVSNQ
ncbi:MAG: DUF1841 family protein [Legionella sp.]|nr:DUF1841 family protein [Legionella sp.]